MQLNETPGESTDNWDNYKKDEIYEKLTIMKTDKIDKKKFKGFFELAQRLMKYKADVVVELMSSGDFKGAENKENILFTEQLRETIEKLEMEKNQQKIKIKELTDELNQLHKKYQDLTSTTLGVVASSGIGGGSSSDSPDALSEIDRQEELLHNISTKNKHIKRLLRDIELLERQHIEQSHGIIELQSNLNEATCSLTLMTNKLTEQQLQLNEQSDIIIKLNVQNQCSQEQLIKMEQEQNARDESIAKFGKQIEERAKIWRTILDEKEQQFDSLKLKYENILEQNPGYDIDAERIELKRLTETIKERDEMIKEMETKLISITNEMLTSTQFINNIVNEREKINADKPIVINNDCCSETKLLLENANKRCIELQEMLSTVEDDNINKSKQVTNAIEALHSYQSGEDGLAQTIKKNFELQNKINSRDKQIRALVMELNSLQETTQENYALRKRLGIPDEEIISTKSFAAKQRKIEKLNERLMLKLRASEEMRLQLKLEKNDLRRQISQLKLNSDIEQLEKPDKDSLVNLFDNIDTSIDVPASTTNCIDNKYCENCLKQYNILNILCASCTKKFQSNQCCDCEKKRSNEANISVTENKRGQEIDEHNSITLNEYKHLQECLHNYIETIRLSNSNLNIADELSQILNGEQIINQQLLLKNKENLPSFDNKSSSDTLNERQNKSPINQQQQQIIDTINNKPIEALPSDSFPTFHQYLIDQDKKFEEIHKNLTELTLTNHQLIDECDSLKIYKDQYNDLLKTIEQNEEKNQNKFSEIYSINTQHKINLKHQQNKLIFLQTDYDNLLNRYREKHINFNSIIYDLKVSFIEQQHHRTKISNKRSSILDQLDFISSFTNTDKFDELTEENFKLKNQLNQLIGDFFKNIDIIDIKNTLDIDLTKLKSLSIIDNDLNVNLITILEFNNLKNEIIELNMRNVKLLEKCERLENLLEINKQQLNQQQIMASNYSEEEIQLRHLIVDLQSETNEKYIIVKAERDIQQLKLHEQELLEKNKRFSETIENLEIKLNKLEENLQQERENHKNNLFNKDLKIRYFIKSLNELNKNYSKYMPLYPIIDFVKDYSKILNSQREINMNSSISMSKSNEEINIIVQDIQKTEPAINGIQDKIEILKWKTQCNYLENQLKLCEEQNNILSMKLEQLQLHEFYWTQHWKTIELLFGESSVTTTVVQNVQIPLINQEIQVDVEKKDKFTITDTTGIDNISIPERVSKYTETIQQSSIISSPPVPPAVQQTTTSSTICNSPTKQIETISIIDLAAYKSIEAQLKQAIQLATSRNAQLLESENRLNDVQIKLKFLEKSLNEKDRLISETLSSTINAEQSTTIPLKKINQSIDDNILSTTIVSLQNLLLEKDTTLSRYQDLLRNEHENRTKSYDEHRNEIKLLQNTIDDLEIKNKLLERELSTKRNEHGKLTIHHEISNISLSPVTRIQQQQQQQQNQIKDNSTTDVTTPVVDQQQVTDKSIEEMFLDEQHHLYDIDENRLEITNLEQKLKQSNDEIKKLQINLRDVSNREKLWEKKLNEKDKEITELGARIKTEEQKYKDNQTAENISNSNGIEQLREMLEEKDRHIQDLTDTLTHFHDDQQKFLNDTTIQSAEQVAELSANLNRTEATNRILNTQIDAHKRQIINLTQREKQSRDLVKSLKTQLIKRPVISIKTDRSQHGINNTNGLHINREEQLQKRVQQLEQEILLAKDELSKQKNVLETKRSRDSNELELWNKQKRYQQLAENLKIKLTERENEIEKLKTYLQTAKTTITRMERERLKNLHTSSTVNNSSSRYCQSASCPNIHSNQLQHFSTKYTIAESPESYRCNSDSSVGNELSSGYLTGPDRYQYRTLSTALSPHRQHQHHHHHHLNTSDSLQQQQSKHLIVDFGNNEEFIEVLKTRIEAQQRKIMALELEGKGKHAMTREIEKLQEQISSTEAQNLRLEAKNLQLQLDLGLYSNRDENERTKKQIKHLEDYIIVLKEELAEAISTRPSRAITSQLESSSTTENNINKMEQTILTLRRVIERLKVENKNLRDGKIMTNRSNSGISKEVYEKLRNEYDKIQQAYSDTLNKLSSLKIELELKNVTCNKCQNRINSNQSTSSSIIGISEFNNDYSGELRMLKEKLIQKTQLLDKAKILLTRAIAKEKNLREQIFLLKRKCSELQNVPIIDEASE